MFAKNPTWIKIAILSLLSVIMTACGPRTLDASSLPKGEFKNSYITLDLNNGNFAESVEGLTGPVELGTYEVNGNHISFHVTKFPGAADCADFPNYSYAWKLDPDTNQLTFTDAQDTCDIRSGLFTSAGFTFTSQK